MRSTMNANMTKKIKLGVHRDGVATDCPLALAELSNSAAVPYLSQVAIEKLGDDIKAIKKNHDYRKKFMANLSKFNKEEKQQQQQQAAAFFGPLYEELLWIMEFHVTNIMPKRNSGVNQFILKEHERIKKLLKYS